MSRSIVCIEEFISTYKIPSDICERFLPCDPNVCVVDATEFERFRRSRKRRAEDSSSDTCCYKNGVARFANVSEQNSMTLASWTAERVQSSLTAKPTEDFDWGSFEIIDSESGALTYATEDVSPILCMSNEFAEADRTEVDVVEILQSSDFQHSRSNASSPPLAHLG
ncbi:LADA_0H19548g1_1 [Lachancea dasiensis]|uniref:LADA_0H19548g1_1 n=1 Tax=Lachancea dasiensis TaxID=1072105 RepID=A0A1G4K6D8_9SACH|nr:LADA_0H19548g1_1 [Lachancea dasiensis]